MTTAQRRALIGFLGGLSLFLSTIEYLFPKPLPFFRLGLANLPILMGFGVLNFKEILLLAALKILGQGLINGTLASYVFLFSLGGTIASVVAMYGFYRLFPRSSGYLGISLMGALASNLVQVWLSLTFIFGSSAWVIVPYFLGMGSATGLAMGAFASMFAKRSSWFAQMVNSFGIIESGLPGGLDSQSLRPVDEAQASETNAPPTSPRQSRSKRSPAKEKRSAARKRRRQWMVSNTNPRLLFFLGLASLLAFTFQSNLLFRFIQVCLLFVLAIGVGKRVSLSYFLLLLISVSLFGLLQPAGKVLFSIGGLSITSAALAQGAFRALTLIGFVLSSLVMVQPHLRLPGRVGEMVGQLFSYYEAINRYRGAIAAKSIVNSLDSVLFTVYAPWKSSSASHGPEGCLDSEAETPALDKTGGEDEVAGSRDGKEGLRKGAPAYLIAVLLFLVFVFLLILDQLAMSA